MVAATWALVAVTALLVGATAFYAVHTWRIAKKTADAAHSARQSAAAAERSAKAAEEVVELERERQREPGRPEIKVIWSTTSVSPGDPSRDSVRFSLQNIGPGDAYEVGFCCRVEHNGVPHPPTVDIHPPKRIHPQPQQSRGKLQHEAIISYPRVRHARVICICHYTDTYSSSDDPRVYHSVFDNKDGTFPSRYYRHDQPLESPYAEICEACRGAK